MLWNIEERKPATVRRREVVDCFDDDFDCFIAGIYFDANLRVFKIYFVSVTIAGVDGKVTCGPPYFNDQVTGRLVARSG
jgi:hypothetical protein